MTGIGIYIDTIQKECKLWLITTERHIFLLQVLASKSRQIRSPLFKSSNTFRARC